MKIDVLTLFPEMFSGVFNDSILKRAQERGAVELNTVNFRDFSTNKHKKVDDYPYGGGAGMVLRCEPLFAAIRDLKTEDSYILMMTPQGKPYQQSHAYELSMKKHLIILCGHYEGIDQRVIDKIVDEEISIGDYVLTGGELPAMVLIDAVSRYNEGVLSKESIEEESFSNRIIRISAVYKT